MNMSYCRFENTHGDLQDCVRALESYDEISEDEIYYAEKMYHLCERYIQAYEEYVECEE